MHEETVIILETDIECSKPQRAAYLAGFFNQGLERLRESGVRVLGVASTNSGEASHWVKGNGILSVFDLEDEMRHEERQMIKAAIKHTHVITSVNPFIVNLEFINSLRFVQHQDQDEVIFVPERTFIVNEGLFYEVEPRLTGQVIATTRHYSGEFDKAKTKVIPKSKVLITPNESSNLLSSCKKVWTAKRKEFVFWGSEEQRVIENL